jgi:tRNA nucleotidyltransferase/poly(A) polymerase
MKLKNTFIIYLLLFYSSVLTAQQGQQRREAFKQVEAEKIAFFTSYMELTPEEAREFWPVHDDFQRQKNLLVQERQKLSQNFLRNHESLPDKESREIADRYVQLQEKEVELIREFHEKFKTILPPGKVMRFYQAENEFRMQLLRRVRGGGQGRGAGRQGW